MTISRGPLTIEFVGDHENGQQAKLKDANGDTVAIFRNYNDAEFVKELADKLIEVESRVEELQDQINDLEYAAEEDRRERDTLT